MPRKNNRIVPAQETRGGNRVDWRNAQPGEPLPELPADAYPEPDSTPLPDVGYATDYDLGGEA